MSIETELSKVAQAITALTAALTDRRQGDPITPTAVAQPAATPAPAAAPAPAQAPVAAPTQTALPSFQQVQAHLSGAAQRLGSPDPVIAIMREFGGPPLSTVPQASYPALMAKVDTLQAGPLQ